jgi:hypothetical protein
MKTALVLSMVTTAIFTLAPTALAVTITGRIDYAGGPAPGHSFPASHARWRVERHGRTVLRGQTDRNGMFRLRLGTGRYRVIAKYGFGRYRDCASRSITVRHKPVFVHLYCSIK